MSSFVLCLNSVIPTFLIMAVGYLCKRIGMISKEQVLKLNGVIFKVFFPPMLFYNIYTSDLEHAIDIRLVLFVALGILAETAIALLISRFATKQRNRRGVMVQGMFRANTVIVGLPIATELLGDVDLGPVIVALAIGIPIFNVLAVIVLELFNGENVKPLKLIKSIATNPLVDAAALAIAFIMLDIKLPTAILSTVKSMAQAASPVMLFLIGAFFSFDRMGAAKKELIITSLVRLFVFPAIFMFAALAFGFRGTAFVAILTMFASSTATSSFSMSQQLGGDAELAGNIVVVTNALCPLSFFIWSYLFKTLGAF